MFLFGGNQKSRLFFAYGYPIILAPFGEKILFFPDELLGTFIENKFTMYV